MKLYFHKRFTKNFRKRIQPNPKLVKKYQQRIALFLQNPNNPTLKDHQLEGSLIGFRSFSITGNIRVVYEKFLDGIRFYDIGSHNQVY